ncbi:glycine zipper family protein [Chroococcus sp. FPU101]|uniref:glycine zipper family protein n=1 Tax=Chroococcus sp. FPU101 TaxID=1974212 RepID=UPI001A8EA1FE|nr:glycine zipper family protein [Chroococcus sp. FPU101]GFE68540.1 hypothetical protein CFPU101_11500 [Chroococcus sp. FPU101]
MKKVSKLIGLSFLGIILFQADLNLAQAPSPPFAYPSRGQNVEEQQQDHFACYTWAKQQTGIDPAAFSAQFAAQSAQSFPKPGGAIRGAAGGAALGAVGGAIGGNAGEGAAIGAGVGALAGLFRRHRAEEQAQQASAQAATQEQQAVQLYYRAWTTCMQARGYTVN